MSKRTTNLSLPLLPADGNISVEEWASQVNGEQEGSMAKMIDVAIGGLRNRCVVEYGAVEPKDKTRIWINPNESDPPAPPSQGSGGVPVIPMTAATAELQPNKFYKWGEVSSLTITFAGETPGILNEYKFLFKASASGATLKVPASVKWFVQPEIVGGSTYEVSVSNNLGVIIGVKA